MGKPFTFRDRLVNWASRRMPVKWARSRLTGPVASITFDDFPRSAWTAGGPIVERFGGRATYFTAGRFCGIREEGIDYYDADDLRALHAAGHEVGSHTYFHQHVPEVRSSELLADARRNADFVRGILGEVELSSFAFPFGDVSPRTKLLFSRLYPCCRGIRPGINAGLLDLGQLWAVSLEVRHWTAERIEQQVAEAKARNGWIVFFTHDVSETPAPYGSTPAILEHALRTVTEAGIEVLPVRDALRRATA
ncbi:MAG TPA: polysaccharide deacetylase family protein [Longimicrobium sp.]|jgi:peptidoglycan/xylan/chitin deacetylase (PgdA/CDA1 family)|uniref:polysaccharide deacetylase family protein n=1 Tax=Longimicrobium sp. TaxID=2029185 RepID=UPI002ED9B24C